ncbi:uncharacterized protein RHIMIDRAFT_312404 [Rhizopus microsporus ATCC 52813]|uniref:Uncharacterized protein n=1 Tax=Rhizopus microsporus ATCC 52813 TaxID=1340429 RepID=A0A2G4SZH1_RHIZD|nr:uncharacterized protein RHIMIDRAFT_312404 [Rhizopus microsporus ATCC 52813]PHZ14147.1 hypothetical protein RHIMIDRAFT_312404 [Rhizopus microsporus ATCC 52813]
MSIIGFIQARTSNTINSYKVFIPYHIIQWQIMAYNNNSSISLQKDIKEFVKNLPKNEGSEWTNSKIFNKGFHRELKRKLWMPSKAQTQYTRELIDSSSREEQRQAFTKNANNFLDQEEVKISSFTSWKAPDNSQFTHTPRIRPPKVKLG